MRRVSTAVLAALLTVSTVGVAGCTKRKAKAGRSSYGSSDDRTTPTTQPTTTRPSPSRSVSDPSGKACSEILDQVNRTTGMAWRLDDAQTQATADETRKAGNRKCHYTVSRTTALPPAIMSVTLYRIDRRFESTPGEVRERAVRAAKCTEDLPAPPPQVTLAVQCLERHSGTLFDVETTLSGPVGYVFIWVAMQPDKASTAVQTRAREIGRQTADVALASV